MTAQARTLRDRAGIVIAGGGLAAQRACGTLRRSGYGGPIRVIAAEPHPPYDRPPLSKEYLAGELEEAALRFRPAAWYADNDIEPQPRTPAPSSGRRSAAPKRPMVADEVFLPA